MGAEHTATAKKGAAQQGAVIVHEDEASFREDPTLFRTWSRRGRQPLVLTTGKRNTQHVYGAIAVATGQFTYHFATVFNGTTFVHFLRQVVATFSPQPVFLVADNARYHKHPDVRTWCQQHQHQIELWPLPPYWPELNATERIWHYVRTEATHNHFFSTTAELVAALRRAFRTIQRDPDTVEGYLRPFR